MGMITFSETITLLTLIFFCLRYISFKDNDSDDLNNDNNHLEDFLLLFVPRPHYNNDNYNMIKITLQTFNYFLSLDMPVMELLGSSETGGPQTACLKVKTYSHKHLFIESEINN